MSLTPASAQALARFRTYVPPATLYHSLPLARRAAVLILLYADRCGDLRVVLTMRASTMKSYAGQAALPGGKADSLLETPFQTARREAFEEIGLPLTERVGPFRIEHLCQLPLNLAKTELGVRPCVAFLNPEPVLLAQVSPITPDDAWAPDSGYDRKVTGQKRVLPTASELLIPQLNPREVAAVFTAPFHNFLKATDEGPGSRNSSNHSDKSVPTASLDVETAGFSAEWYHGSWTTWLGDRWRMHNFYVPVTDQVVVKPKREMKAGKEREVEGGTASGTMIGALEEGRVRKIGTKQREVAEGLESLSRFRVWGMTARILVDAARIAYNEQPEFEHSSSFGDEDMIGRLMKMGKMRENLGKTQGLSREGMKAEAKM